MTVCSALNSGVERVTRCHFERSREIWINCYTHSEQVELALRLTAIFLKLAQRVPASDVYCLGETC